MHAKQIAAVYYRRLGSPREARGAVSGVSLLARQVVPLEDLEPAQRGALAAAQLHHLVPQRLGQAEALLQRNRPRARDGAPRALLGGQAYVAAEEPAERERRGAAYKRASTDTSQAEDTSRDTIG